MGNVETAIRATEGSTYVITVSFTDENGDPVVPDSATWTLTRLDGSIVNDREAVVMVPAESIDILLSGADLANDSGHTLKRRLLVEGVYRSTLGIDLPIKGRLTFTLEDVAD